MLCLPEMSSSSQLEVYDGHSKTPKWRVPCKMAMHFDPLGIENDSVKARINSHRVPSIWSIGPDMFSIKRARIRRSS
jgi:hypothetical protein